MLNHIIDLELLSFSDLQEIVQLAGKIMKNPENYSEACKGKILGTLFYEPSTRTKMSFQTAMLRLGGSVIGFDNPSNSSVSKGESLKDTIKIVSGYADIIAMRHPLEGSAKGASKYSSVPIINAGDGGHLHPTQTLTDIVTLHNEKGRLNHLTIGLCGDLKNGRTVHSLIKTMSHFEGNKFVLISTKELGIPKYIKDIIQEQNCEYVEVPTLQEAMPQLDVLYMTRIQRERFASMEEYEAQKGVFVLDREKLSLGKEDLKVLHPLPRVDEIAENIDDDPRCVYFKQAIYGMYARMALILLTLQGAKYSYSRGKIIIDDGGCVNPRCITHTEPYMPKEFKEKDGYLVCEYCDTAKKPGEKLKEK